jgi:hypothetical protein
MTDPTLSFNDLHVLTLDTLTWAKIETFGIPGTPRNSHAAEFFDKTLHIFGGSNAKAFIRGELHIVEFDERAVEKLVREDRRIEESARIRELIKARKEVKLTDSAQLQVRSSENSLDSPNSRKYRNPKAVRFTSLQEAAVNENAP